MLSASLNKTFLSLSLSLNKICPSFLLLTADRLINASVHVINDAAEPDTTLNLCGVVTENFTQTEVVTCARPVHGRHLRISRSGPDPLTLCEVDVCGFKSGCFNLFIFIYLVNLYIYNASNHPPPATDSGRTACTPLYPQVQAVPPPSPPPYSLPLFFPVLDRGTGEGRYLCP